MPLTCKYLLDDIDYQVYIVYAPLRGGGRGSGGDGRSRRDSAAGAASSLHSSSTRPQADESRSWWSAGRSGTTKPHVHPAGQHLALRSRSVPLSAAASAARLRGDHRRTEAGLPSAGAASREAIVATSETPSLGGDGALAQPPALRSPPAHSHRASPEASPTRDGRSSPRTRAAPQHAPSAACYIYMLMLPRRLLPTLPTCSCSRSRCCSIRTSSAWT